VTNVLATIILQAAAPAAGGLSPIWLPLQVVGIGLVFYFLMIRPQAQARKKQAALLNALKKGDDVMTVGGIVGTVKDIKELKERGETRVTIETGTSQIVVERSRIIRVGNDSASGTPTPV
jgi:preprotein translocase subunit YajC